MQPEIEKIIYVLITRYFLINFLNQFLLSVPFYIPPENIRKPHIDFMTFPESMKRKYLEDMG